jgi:DNA polymerase-1
MNRKRTIDELNNKNYMIRSQGERMALNTPIQGTSADIIKKAMVDIEKAFLKKSLPCMVMKNIKTTSKL